MATLQALVDVDRLPQQVRKRKGTLQAFSAEKIKRAISASYRDAFSGHNMEGKDFELWLEQTVHRVLISLSGKESVPVDVVQDTVETVLMESGRTKVAKAYILWRDRRDRARARREAPMGAEAISDYISLSKYACYLPDQFRREVYQETVNRARDMHIRRYPFLKEEITAAFQDVADKKVLPSMRSLQFGGKAIEMVEERLFNCTFSPVDRLDFFGQAFFLLLCGCGVGFSVQKHHVAKLPPMSLVDFDDVRHFVVEDSVQGWGDALHELMKSVVEGYYVEFSFHQIRGKGALLKTSGGRAPGHFPLKESLERIRDILYVAQGRHLKTIEAHDIICIASDAVLAGGIRRSALVSLFSVDDEEMMNAKTGDWGREDMTPWRARANNSAMLVRGEVTYEQYARLFEATRQWGEPGFYFCNNRDYGSNPCMEIGLNPNLVVSEEDRVYLAERGVEANVGDVLVGWSFCNLSEVNVAKCKTPEDLYAAVRSAAVVGTLQAGYTNFPYLGAVSELIARRDSLIGVSMTGMMDSPHISFDPEVQREAARVAVETNRSLSKRVGIRPAARVCCTKPSGTASLALGCVGSGIHPHHARRYFRRVKANPLEPVYQHFKSVNPHMCESIGPTDDIITFCVEAPEDAIVIDDLTAMQFLEKVLLTQCNWVIPGTVNDVDSPGLTHNVSNTIVVREGEWEQVRDFLWDNREYFSGVSMVPHCSDKIYPNAPREAVVTEQDEAKWNYLSENYKPVDYTAMFEIEDTTKRQGEVACAGGACLIQY